VLARWESVRATARPEQDPTLAGPAQALRRGQVPQPARGEHRRGEPDGSGAGHRVIGHGRSRRPAGRPGRPARAGSRAGSPGGHRHQRLPAVRRSDGHPRRTPEHTVCRFSCARRLADPDPIPARVLEVLVREVAKIVRLAMASWPGLVRLVVLLLVCVGLAVVLNWALA